MTKYLADLCVPDNFQRYSINPMVLSHACTNILEHLYDPIYAAIVAGASEYELCHKYLRECDNTEYSRHGYEDIASLQHKIKRHLNLILAIVQNPSEEMQSRVPDPVRIVIGEHATACQQWFTDNKDHATMEVLYTKLHQLHQDTAPITEVHESIEKREELRKYLENHVSSVAKAKPIVSDLEGGTVPEELKQAKSEFHRRVLDTIAWLNQPPNAVLNKMEYATRLAELRNDGIRIELNTHSGHYEILKINRLQKTKRPQQAHDGGEL